MKNKAFTLIEITIVMIIISVIIGLILSGENLIKSSQYRNIIADFNYYFTNIKNFQSRYNAFPGDMTGTSSYWTGTNDGNNDGKIGIGDGSDPSGEPMRAWQHLSLSTLVSANFTGVTAGTPSYKNGVNTPYTPIDKAFYSIYYFNYATGIYGKSQNAIALASQNSISGVPWANAILTPADAFFIDSKADDGSPYTGQIYAVRGDNYFGIASKCVTNDYSSTTSSYVFTDTSATCRLLYWLK